MFIDGMSYNCGQADDGLEKYHQMIASGEFPLQDFYKLPIAEMLSKAIAISFYSGLIDLRALGQRFGVDLNIYFENEIKIFDR